MTKVTIRTRMLLLVALTGILFGITGIVKINTFENFTKANLRSEFKSVVASTSKLITAQVKEVNQSDSETRKDVISNVLHTLENIKPMGDGYYFVLDEHGEWLSHPDTFRVGRRTSIPEIAAMAKSARRNGAAYAEYEWKGANKLAYAEYNSELDMVIGTGSLLTELEATRSGFIVDAIIESLSVMLILGIAMYMLYISIEKPLVIFNGLMGDVSRGDLTSRAPDLGKSEMGVLGSSINVTLDSFSKMIKELQDAIVKLEAGSKELGLVASTGEEGNRKQQVELELVSTAITEMAATVQEVAGNIVGTAEAATQANAFTVKGSEAVEETIYKMGELSNQTTEAMSSINRLAEATLKISDIVATIDGVASQTNLLALNAAIEAARAGPAGRGFAVVADEVRTLSHRTGDNLSEIREVIDNLQVMAKATVELMEVSINQVNVVSSVADTTNESVDTISTSVKDIEAMAAQIASATEEQVVVTEDISRNIVAISTLAGESVETSKTITATTVQLDTLANNLNEMVSKFKV